MPSVLSQNDSRLTELLGRLGYGEELIARDVTPPGVSTNVARLDLVAFTRPAPHDLRTSAIVGELRPTHENPGRTLELCRAIAAPFLLLGLDGPIDLYSVGRSSEDDRLVHTFDGDDIRDAPVLRSLDPVILHQAKTRARQLTLFPVDVRLLDQARHRSVGSLQSRLEAAFAYAIDRKVPAGEAAQLVISALSCVVVKHKSSTSGFGPAAMVASALQRHREYFEVLAEWEANDQPLVESILTELGQSVDFSAIDARSLNSIYERLFLTPELRKKLGIHYTPFEFANRMLEALPIEELPPKDRRVYDPACGSGNLLLAAQERLDALAPNSWSPETTHTWLKSHLSGSDIDPMAVLLAKHSLLVSALPMGNTWNVACRDFLAPPGVEPRNQDAQERPNLIVSNPPWKSRKGSRHELATDFLEGAVGLLADGGFLACVLPVSWLTADRDRRSRSALGQACEIFEVWRHPRDVFPGARVGCAVVFARKNSGTSPRRAAFRWVNAGAGNRSAFLESGRTNYRALLPQSAPGDMLTTGPIAPSPDQSRPPQTLGSVVTAAGGVVQRGDLVPVSKPGRRSIPVLGRGASPPVYRVLDGASITWVDSTDELLGSDATRDARRVAPKILVQADRFADNPWRLRPVIDTVGVVPVNLWHALFPPDLETAFALLTILSSSTASLWLHSHVTPNRITIDTLLRLPLPFGFEGRRKRLADLGRQLAQSGPSPKLLARIESTVDSLYGLSPAAKSARDQMMAGFDAPEGSKRFPRTAGQPIERPGSDTEPRAGAVLAVEGDRLRIWTIDAADEDGVLTTLPMNMPGWMAVAGATFDLRGDIETGRYTFHRSSHLANLPIDPNDTR